MSWVISKKDNCILQAFKRIFDPKDTKCKNKSCDNVICYYFDNNDNDNNNNKIKIKILCVCDRNGKKLDNLGYITFCENKNKNYIYCSEECK